MIKYAVIENEYYSAKQLIKFVASVRPDYRLCFCAESVEDTVELLRSSPDLDLIFMDIELVDGDCFDIIRKVEIDVPVIFTTAYSDFAIKAFRMYCIDYILKPLTEEKIGKALDRFRVRFEKRIGRFLITSPLPALRRAGISSLFWIPGTEDTTAALCVPGMEFCTKKARSL